MEEPSVPAAAAAALLLALVHVRGGRLRFVSYIPRSGWLSFAGGVSVAYVFVHLLPELAVAQESVGEAGAGLAIFAERHVYLIALLGLGVFYGLDVLALRSRARPGGRPTDGTGGAHSPADRARDGTPPGVFWIHIGSFALYNGLVGYLLLHRETPGLLALALFATAMAFHFFVNDAGLREHHRDRYDHRGRWILAAAVLVGLGIGLLVVVGEAALGVLLAFLAGGVILNVLKEEVPQERKSRFAPFVAGLVGYAALLLAL